MFLSCLLVVDETCFYGCEPFYYGKKCCVEVFAFYHNSFINYCTPFIYKSTFTKRGYFNFHPLPVQHSIVFLDSFGVLKVMPTAAAKLVFFSFVVVCVCGGGVNC